MLKYEKMISSVQNVYNHIQDDISREIYVNRMLYSCIDDYNALSRLVHSLPIKFLWIEQSQRELLQYVNKGYEIILAGGGVVGRCVRAVLGDIPWLCFCDKTVRDEKIDGLKVISRSEAISEHGNSVFVVSSTKYYDEIELELKNAGINKIYNLGRLIREATTEHIDKQYFECLSVSDKEVFIDAGCYDCGTIFEFQKKTNFKYKKIYSFEPESQLYENCKSIIDKQEIKDCELINLGLWNTRDRLHFLSMGDGSRINQKGNQIIHTIALDEFAENKEIPSFIKMDIEGAELKALLGARKIIDTYSPKLAISVYHKKEDIFTIPDYILSVNPNYKFYFRHYSGIYADTVLYAYVD